jgi:asparagine synthase (glutamine-hydrolysing)
MLMASSVEGRFPFLDAQVIALAASLPAAYKLAVLDEKHVVKRAARGLVPDAILGRKKQPYRAPDALSFVGPGAPAWVDDLVDERAVRQAGVFDPAAVTMLFRKCRARAAEGRFSNADDMAVVGVLSTSLLHRTFVAERPSPRRAPRLATLVDRLGGSRAPR